MSHKVPLGKQCQVKSWSGCAAQSSVSCWRRRGCVTMQSAVLLLLRAQRCERSGAAGSAVCDGRREWLPKCNSCLTFHVVVLRGSALPSINTKTRLGSRPPVSSFLLAAVGLGSAHRGYLPELRWIAVDDILYTFSLSLTFTSFHCHVFPQRWVCSVESSCLGDIFKYCVFSYCEMFNVWVLFS